MQGSGDGWMPFQCLHQLGRHQLDIGEVVVPACVGLLCRGRMLLGSSVSLGRVSRSTTPTTWVGWLPQL